MRIPKHMAVAASTLAFAGSAAFITTVAGPASAAVPATVQGGFGGFGRGESFNPGDDFIVEEGDFFVNEEDGAGAGGAAG
jgi:hypothetical protein